jgi:hypothetical protein
MQSFILRAGTYLLLLYPFATSAQDKPTDLESLVAILVDLIGTLILLVFALTLLAFMWGIIRGWIIQGGEAEGIQSGKNVVVVGIIALVIMSSIWGILYMLQSGIFG